MSKRNQMFRNQNTVEQVHKALISLQSDGKTMATNRDIIARLERNNVLEGLLREESSNDEPLNRNTFKYRIAQTAKYGQNNSIAIATEKSTGKLRLSNAAYLFYFNPSKRPYTEEELATMEHHNHGHPKRRAPKKVVKTGNTTLVANLASDFNNFCNGTKVLMPDVFKAISENPQLISRVFANFVHNKKNIEAALLSGTNAENN